MGQTFFHLVSLRTAAEFITLTLLINKVTGFYGILAIFTGYHLNPLQLSHYIYSILILFLAAWLAPALRNPRDPLRNLSLAWLYVLDTIINTAYTALFGMGWFVLLAQHHLDETPSGIPAAGKSTMEDTAGFVDPQVPGASSVDVVATPAKGALTGQDAVAIPNLSSGAPGSAPTSFAGLILQGDSLTSIILLVLFALIRVYFCIVIMTYARSILRGYIASTSSSSMAYSTAGTASADASMAENPFSADAPAASRLGRVMTAFPTRRYWLGRDEYPAASQSEWERVTTGRFEAAAVKKSLEVKIPAGSAPLNSGVGERERRARSGTGPPPPQQQQVPGTPK